MTEDKTINNVVVSMPYGVSKRGELNVLAKREHIPWYEWFTRCS